MAPNTPPSARRPWAGETPTMPTRIGGQRLVSAVKLPTGSGPHRWVVIVEIGKTETYQLGYLGINSQGYFDIENRVMHVSYDSALKALVSEIGGR